MVPALSGGPLQELHLDSGRYAHVNWGWGALNLPHLTTLFTDCRGDAFRAVTRARLPALRSVDMHFNAETTAVSVSAFAAAVPGLRKMVLRGPDAASSNSAVVQALGSEVMPLLESFKWIAKWRMTAAMARRFLPEGPAEGAPSWLRLFFLNLALYSDRRYWGVDSTELGFLPLFAPHCPALASLHVGRHIMMTLQDAEALVAAARDADAWPLLRTLNVPRFEGDKTAIIQKLQEAWPALEVE